MAYYARVVADLAMRLGIQRRTRAPLAARGNTEPLHQQVSGLTRHINRKVEQSNSSLGRELHMGQPARRDAQDFPDLTVPITPRRDGDDRESGDYSPRKGILICFSRAVFSASS